LFPGIASEWSRLDGPAGSLVVAEAADAVHEYLISPNVANLGAPSSPSMATAGLVDEARGALARLLGAVGERVVLGPSATALLGRLADAFEAQIGHGDEIVCSELEHDAKVSPWLELANRTGATVRFARASADTLDLPVEALADALTARTRIVAITAASNVVGTTPDIAAAAAVSHDAGAVLVVDAVHGLPHGLFGSVLQDADAVVCSAYKFFGPHLSALALSAELLDSLCPRRIRPAPAEGPASWERGALPFELLPGVIAAANYLENLDWDVTRAYERALVDEVVDGLRGLPRVRLLGAPTARTSTMAFTVAGRTPAAVAAQLAERRVAISYGNLYAPELLAKLELDGAVRVGLLHYNTFDDVDRLLEGLAAL
jgi:cysteine desulfurase family protein (TIGR01976 family)